LTNKTKDKLIEVAAGFIAALLLGIVVGSMTGCKSIEAKIYPESNLDNLPMAPNSMHHAHLSCGGDHYGVFIHDDGTIIRIFFTGGTQPYLEAPCSGELYASVPSYEDNDADGTYYFIKFVPDKKVTK
jgi:hypothetical protein